MNEIEQIFSHITQGNNFLLSGGAGSGKTYTLVQVIRKVISDNPSKKVACMTYTNAAVKEIEERVNHENLNVSTIHDFLWDNIKHFQKELKVCLVELANDSSNNVVRVTDEESIPNNFFDGLEHGIQYREYVRISEGIISHDQIIELSSLMFLKYPKLSGIVKDKYPFIFVDEYQDTHPNVVKIFLEHFKLSEKKAVIGFFGDAMQSIYEGTVGSLDIYKGSDGDTVREVKKAQNRRNPSKIIELANKLRTDGLVQEPSDDPSAPNMLNGSVKTGIIRFLHSSTNQLNRAKEYLGWDLANSDDVKELNLTHNLIAGKANIRTLMDIYNGDGVLAYRDRIKDYLKNNTPSFDMSHMTFGEVVDTLVEGKTGADLRRVQPTPGMKTFIDGHPELYEKARSLSYELFSKMYVDKDQLLDDKKDDDSETGTGSKRDELIRHLHRLQQIIWSYQTGKYNEFLKVSDYRGILSSVALKRQLKEWMDELSDVGTKSVLDVIEFAHSKGICMKSDGLVRFETEKKYIYDRVSNVPYSEVQSLYEYLEGRTPFSTQHKTKGAEYDKVLVILDNGGWRNYNFECLFTGGCSDSVSERTQKLFYVCCTRSKEELAIYYNDPNPSVLNVARNWFGEENVIDIEN